MCIHYNSQSHIVKFTIYKTSENKKGSNKIIFNRYGASTINRVLAELSAWSADRMIVMRS